jgi:hypothetical protein
MGDVANWQSCRHLPILLQCGKFCDAPWGMTRVRTGKDSPSIPKYDGRLTSHCLPSFKAATRICPASPSTDTASRDWQRGHRIWTKLPQQRMADGGTRSGGSSGRMANRHAHSKQKRLTLISKLSKILWAFKERDWFRDGSRSHEPLWLPTA